MGSGKYPEKTRFNRRTFGKIEAHLTQELQQVKWAEFELQELFDIENTLSFNKDRLIEGDEYDYVTRTSQNQGVLQTTGFVNKENINPAGTWSLGLIQMDFFYREKPWYAGQFVRKIIPKLDLNKSAVIFFSTILNKQKQNLLSVLVRNVDTVFKSTKISLPIKPNTNLDKLAQIDFDFMENFISQLEAFRLSQLEAYLLVTGLKNYTLTAAEQQALADFENGKVVWVEYELQELFEVKTSKKRFDANKIKIEDIGYPYVVRTATNNGIKGYLNEDEMYLNEGNTISFGQDTATMFYQEKPYFTGDKIKILKPKYASLNKRNAQFFIPIMARAFSSFSWGSSSFSEEIIKSQKIFLPIKPNTNLDKLAQIDFGFMETLISAVQKLVIKEVVLYADRKIAATRQVIEGD